MDISKLTIDYWWNARPSDMPIVQTAAGLICLDGWNGEIWTKAFKVIDRYTEAAPGVTFEVRPVYRFEDEDINLDELEENTPEWFRATEVVDLMF